MCDRFSMINRCKRFETQRSPRHCSVSLAAELAQPPEPRGINMRHVYRQHRNPARPGGEKRGLKAGERPGARDSVIQLVRSFIESGLSASTNDKYRPGACLPQCVQLATPERRSLKIKRRLFPPHPT